MPAIAYPGPVPYANRSGRLIDLVRQRGMDAADAELRAGEIQAQMWSNLGNTIAGSIGSIMQERQEAPMRALREKAAQQGIDINAEQLRQQSEARNERGLMQ